jgi:quinol monooxygenase YgiN
VKQQRDELLNQNQNATNAMRDASGGLSTATNPNEKDALLEIWIDNASIINSNNPRIQEFHDALNDISIKRRDIIDKFTVKVIHVIQSTREGGC